tara:strand:+ start:90 stop:353 length:264 start_codon:yes stop_codon:yes gene_type:complete
MANTKVTSRVLADDAVTIGKLNITNDPSDGQALTAEAVTDGYNLKWATISVSQTLTVVGRSSNTNITVTSGAIAVETRSGSNVNVGV